APLRRAFIVLCLGVFVVPPTFAQDASARIKAAQYALGMIRGPQRIDAINTIEYWGIGVNYTYHVSLSYLTPAMRVDIGRLTPTTKTSAKSKATCGFLYT